MPTPTVRFRRFCADQSGGTAIEYALIASLIAVAAISGMTALGGSSNGSWANTANKVGNAMK
jgi:pilus assembly protein Flp/PilA